MKLKSHTSKWAMALCAFAVFSFTAQGALKRPIAPPSPAITPSTETDNKDGKQIQPAPLPPTPAPVTIGTFTGTVTE